MAPLHSQGCEGAAYPRLDTRLQSPKKTNYRFVSISFPPRCELTQATTQNITFLNARLGRQGARHLGRLGREGQGGPGAAVERKGGGGPRGKPGSPLGPPWSSLGPWNLLRVLSSLENRGNSPLKIWAPLAWLSPRG